jgi:hypothetical protein
MPAPEGFSEQRLDMLILETHKATTAFFDRLLLVNGGTLSFIITVGSTALLTSQHPLTLDAGLRQQILVGCYLFASSFFFCLLHNYLKLPGMATALRYSLRSTGHYRGGVNGSRVLSAREGVGFTIPTGTLISTKIKHAMYCKNGHRLAFVDLEMGSVSTRIWAAVPHASSFPNT